MAPAEFMRQMARLVRARRARDAAALYARHGAAVAPRLSAWDRETLAALMEYVDTVTGWTPRAGGLESAGECEQPDRRSARATG
jgi:hypothetical protein